MTKYAIILASLLTLTACQSGRNADHSSASTSTGSSWPDSNSATVGTSNSGDSSTQSTSPSTTDNTTTGSSSASTSPSQNSTPSSDSTATPSSDTASPSPAAQSTADTVTGSTSGQLNQSPNAVTTPAANPPGNATVIPDIAAGTGQTTIGQSTAGSDATAQDITSPAGGMRASDRVLTQSVTNALMTAGIPSQTLTNIQVRAMNGRVILSGQVNNQAEKQRITTQVKQTPGVQAVIDQLRIAQNPNPSGVGTDSSAVGGTGTGTTDTGTGNSSTPPDSNQGSTPNTSPDQSAPPPR